MMNRKLATGMNEVEEIFEKSGLLGIDVIELRWTPDNGLPYHAVAKIVGYRVPRITGEITDMRSDANALWVDGSLKFYPDRNGICWGYVYDTPENRELMYNSFNNGCYMIFDRRIRDEIKAEAIERGIDVNLAEKVTFSVKKTVREKQAEKAIETTSSKLEEALAQVEALKDKLAKVSGEKAEFVNKRAVKPLGGVKIQNRQEIQEKLTNAD